MGRFGICLLGLVAVFLFAGCQSDSDEGQVLPTLFVVSETPEPPSASNTPQPIEVSEAGSVSSRPTLIPTFTPQPTSTPQPTFTPRPTTPADQFRGTLYYIYNNSQIIAQRSVDDIQVVFDAGAGTVQDLVFSPDDTLMAFVAAGNGSAQEVFVASLDGSYLQQVSCVGHAGLRNPVWSGDGTALAWVSGQTVDTPLDVYAATVVGSNNCPVGNNQKLLSDLNIEPRNFGGIAMSFAGDYVIFSNVGTYTLSVADGTLSQQLTNPRGFGADFNHRFAPDDTGILAYLQVSRSGGETMPPGNMYIVDASDPDSGFRPITEWNPGIIGYEWIDSDSIVAAARNQIFTTSISDIEPVVAVDDIDLLTMPAASSDGESIIYTVANPAQQNSTLVYMVDTSGQRDPELIFDISGTLSDLQWLTPIE